MKEYNLGIDLGNNSIKAVVLNNKQKIVEKLQVVHHGNPLEKLQDILLDISTKYPDILVSFSGINASLVVEDQQIIKEIPAIEKGALLLWPQVSSIIEIGSQSAFYITNINESTPPIFAINDNCAGGTGSFFEDQMHRLGLKIEDYSNIVKQAKSIPRITGRCSVFAKSDIIHSQQEGVDIADILLGLCYATITNYKATIIKNLEVIKPIVLAGGIVKNSGIIQATKDIFNLEDSELLVSEDNIYLQAIGTCILSEKLNKTMKINEVLVQLESKTTSNEQYNIYRLDPLKVTNDIFYRDIVKQQITTKTKCSLGIDIGSTSTNLILIDTNQKIIDYLYLRTKGNPQQVVKNGLHTFGKKYDDLLEIVSVGVTGSGRVLIGEMIGADVIKDEISAQAKAAIIVDPKVDTVFEIGGQDSKYIQIEDERLKDFAMNKICAAGTGSFIEEQAIKLDVDIEEYGEYALRAKQPVDLGERCTVFIETNIANCLNKGVNLDDILAGLAYSIIKNYAIKVVNNKPVGKNILLQGGVCYNPAVVAAFKAVYGDNVKISPYFSISGAYGVAAYALEENKEKESKFKGFNLDKKSVETTFDFSKELNFNKHLYQQERALLLEGYTRELDENKPTIGVPFVLVVHKFFPMIKNFFEDLGFNVLLSKDTDEEIIALSQKYTQAQTCYPVKLIYGHMAWLAAQKVDYIFLPSVITMKHEISFVDHNYGCVYMQSAPKMIFDNLQLEKQGIQLLNPLFNLDFGQEAMAKSMIGIGTSLNKSKTSCTKALLKGAMAIRKHGKQVEKIGQQLLENIKPNEKVIVLVTRNYGLSDPVLNMGIADELLKRGHKVITMGFLPAHDLDISKEYNNLYWPFGQHIISACKMIANHPNLYAIYLTNHGCGPDTMLAHLFKNEMGNKPYLGIEVDEHYSKVGLITRLEAFLNSLNTYQNKDVEINHDYLFDLKTRNIKIEKQFNKAQKIYLPYLYPYSDKIAQYLNSCGFEIEVLKKTSNESLMQGRLHTMSKEYLSFIAMLGDVLTKEKELTTPASVFIPQTQGSESDGMYSRVIYDYLKADSNLSIISSDLETLAFDFDMNKIFNVILACDLIMQLEPTLRADYFNNFDFTNPNFDNILELAKSLEVKPKQVDLVGEPLIMYNDFLNSNSLNNLENANIKVGWMLLSEYLLFMWYREAKNKLEEKIVANYLDKIKQINGILKDNTCFASSIEELVKIADTKLNSFHGANGSYRFAKALSSKAKAVFDIASAYENTQTILSIINSDKSLPILYLNYEGSNDQIIKEQIDSFIYYLNN